MEDLTIDDLIADVISNPTAARVPCGPAPPPAVLPGAPVSRGISRVLGDIVRRVSGRLRQ